MSALRRNRPYQINTVMIKKRIWNSLRQGVAIAVLLTLAYACQEQTKQEPDEDLKKAFDVHNESVEIRKKVDVQINELRGNQDPTFIATNQGQLDSIYQLVEGWDEQMIEVPGFEHAHDHSDHDHDHHHHHHHDHMEDLDLTPAEHLEIQQHLNKEITSIEKALTEIQR